MSVSWASRWTDRSVPADSRGAGAPAAVFGAAAREADDALEPALSVCGRLEPLLLPDELLLAPPPGQAIATTTTIVSTLATASAGR